VPMARYRITLGNTVSMEISLEADSFVCRDERSAVFLLGREPVLSLNFRSHIDTIEETEMAQTHSRPDSLERRIDLDL